MKLSSELSYDFDSRVRQRGLNYFRTGRVEIIHGSDVAVGARVRGASLYQVSLEWTKRALETSCSCPYFEDGGGCKHLWATILAAEAEGYLTAGSFGRSPAPAYWLPAAPQTLPPKPPRWREQLSEIERRSNGGRPARAPWPERRQLVYVIDLSASRLDSSVMLQLFTRDRKKNDAGWTRLKELRLPRGEIAGFPSSADREVLSLLSGTRQSYSWSYSDYDTVPSRCQVLHPLAGMVMPVLCQTGHCYLRHTANMDDLVPITWDDGEPWRFLIEVARKDRGKWVAAGGLRRGEERLALSAPELLTAGGLVFHGQSVARLDETAPFEWIKYLRECGGIEASQKDRDELLAALFEHPDALALELPEEWRHEDVSIAPRPCLVVRAVRARTWEPQHLRAELWFDYAGKRVADSAQSRGFYDAVERRFIPRDAEAEKAASARLCELGLRVLEATNVEPHPGWQVPPKKLSGVLGALVGAGWDIEAEGKMLRRAGGSRVEVSSGIDWFELRGEVQYGEVSATLPQLLAALRRGENMVQLGDGTYGMLPDEWLARFGPLADMGASTDDHLRFRRNQAGLLDALLSAQPDVRFDEGFARARQELRSFEGIRVAEQPAGFVGRLRDYQREGLGWMDFLRRFGFGGCLADDMGVGKTAQVLALLEARRGEAKRTGPSLIVVPKSLVFNWKQEAARFTPRLRVVDYTGLARSIDQRDGSDVVLTTYGTLRRDILALKEIEFDYLVLDEAQAIKNSQSESAKAARLLQGRHRLALSGTPVENHLGELWSLFEFLNPGMLGASKALKGASGLERNPDEGTRKLLAQGLRPFILRRTKDQVARELPRKTEQTIYCVMDPPQRKLYDELRTHYRMTLLRRIDQEGMGKSKMHVLEALLRLRQAACHPGLLDPDRSGDPSAKLEVLLAHLSEMAEEGHKALVFSQFTSLLRIVRDRLDEGGIVYEYLDGKTRDRQARVERFQDDPECRLFLISLKAGGLGLNLTAAEYVFLLDPWWNPAVEAQAIDRTHRIGQTRQVFAYRLIARDTVEERVVALQDTKRELAAAIFGAGNALIRQLRREDLEVLLS